MDENRPASPVGAPSDGAGVPPEASRPNAARPRGWRGIAGMAAALVVAFVWGGLAYRELGPRTARTAAAAGAFRVVAGAQAPPAWVGEFAGAFCDGNADSIASRIGPPLTGNVAAISDALNARDWSCSRMTYLGSGKNPKGEFFVYVMRDGSDNEQWWVFTVVDGKVVGIE